MYEDILKHKIKELREAKDQKQQAIAEELGVSQGTYNNWETGKRVPELKTILKIADFYEVTLDYLFGRDVETIKKIKEKE
jgi:transcriptional regulator with XRE-family HTH domain